MTRRARLHRDETDNSLDTGVASSDTQLSDKPSGPKVQKTESVAQPPLPPDRLSPFCRTILKWAQKNFLACAARKTVHALDASILASDTSAKGRQEHTSKI
jgi:hypothetical protein